MKQSSYNCKNCKIDFLSVKKKTFCCKECYFLSRKKIVTNICVVCNKQFVVPYRFREKKTCNQDCMKISISKSLTSSITKQCLNCSKAFEATKSYEKKAKYCSSDCFYHHKYERDSKIISKICEGCGKEFQKDFIKRHVRFCSKNCAFSGSRNPMYGKENGMCGKKAWNNGLTTKTDERLLNAGRKISKIQKRQFESGMRSNYGKKNPMFGKTKDLMTQEQREKYSKAAIERVISGVSGYKTGHLNGTYDCKKSSSVKFKSSWELAAMMWWDDCEEVVSYQYEPEIVRLKDGRRAIPDFKVEYVNGAVKIFEIKPTQIQQLESVKEKLNLVKEALNSFGISYELLGDKEIKLMIKDLGENFKNEIERYKSGK